MRSNNSASVPKVSLEQWFSNRGDFISQGTSDDLETFLIVTTRGEEATGIEWVQSRGCCLYVLQYTRHFSFAKKGLIPRVSSGEVEQLSTELLEGKFSACLGLSLTASKLKYLKPLPSLLTGSRRSQCKGAHSTDSRPRVSPELL